MSLHDLEDQIEELRVRRERLKDEAHWRNRPSWEFDQERHDILDAKLDLLLAIVTNLLRR